MEEDEYELEGLRTILNFGHTFAHALESSSKYRKISHGQAVSSGMIYAAKLSLLLKKCSRKTVNQLLDILELFGLPTRLTDNPQRIYTALVHDKKFISGNIRMVLLRKIGKVEVSEKIKPSDLKKTFKVFRTRLC